MVLPYGTNELARLDGALRDWGEQNPSAAATLTRPQRVGPYHVVGVIGEGGMGSVYKAEQQRPVRRIANI